MSQCNFILFNRIINQITYIQKHIYNNLPNITGDKRFSSVGGGYDFFREKGQKP